MATQPPLNHASFSLEELASATRGDVLVRGASDAVGIGTDTRTVVPGNAFVALRGESFDGHAFVAQAIGKGARVVVVERPVEVPPGVSVLRVEDSLVALGAIAHAHRQRLASTGSLRHVVAITGSVGKTTTKEMCATVLSALGERVTATLGNLNNRIGLPLTILAAPLDHTALVLEAGMNVPGEIRLLADIAAPDVAILTSVAAVHTEGVGSLEGVAAEKASLTHGVKAGGLVIATADDAVLAPHLASTSATTWHVGRAEHADVRLVERRGARATYAFSARTEGPATLDVTLGLPGEGAAKNACAALALALHWASRTGHDRDAALATAATALSGLRPSEGRGAALPGIDGTVVLDDAYNASRRSVINALETASELAAARQGRLVAVLGDMLELGAYEEEEHQRVGEAVARVGVSLFVACGRRMKLAADEARELGADLVIDELDPMSAVPHVIDFVAPGDVIVVKGSRSMRMERVVAALRERPAARPDDDRVQDEGGDV